MRVTRSRAETGQASVEAVLTLPLVLFLILGTLQLFMLMQGRVMAQYAVYQAVRAGSRAQGECGPMVHAAVLALLPTITSYLGPATPGGNAGQKLGNAFQSFANNHYANYRPNGFSNPWTVNDPIVWIVRERPNFGAGLDDVARATTYFDQPIEPGSGIEPTRLEVRLIFWAPLRIPFADWVFSRMALAHLGIQNYTAQNPLLMTQQANWQPVPGERLDGPVAAQLQTQVAAARYVFPIEVTYTMRMMTPVRLSYFAPQNCPPTPAGL